MIGSHYYPSIGGVEKVIQELAERQARDGHEVHVYTSDWDKNKRIKKKEEKINGVYVHRCRHIARISTFSVIFPSLFFRLLKENFDIIHTHVFGHLHFFISSLIARIKKIPHIHTTHCPWTDSYRTIIGRMGILISYNLFSRFGLKITDKVIAITPWEVDFIKKYGAKKEKIVILPNGMNDFLFVKNKNNDFKKRNNISGKMVLFFGRLNITKGPEKFVEIAKLILKEREDITFVIRGPDEGMRNILKKMIANEKKIILLDETTDKKEINDMYHAAELYVMPSFREGLPLTLFEAMATGLPIVASPVNGVPFEVKEGENGFLVKYGNNEEFKKKILQIIDNPRIKKEISIRNVQKVKGYLWESIYQRTMEIYFSLIKKRKFNLNDLYNNNSV
jgi:glycosyltransferase involved in cell wall biosynthesis